MKRLFILQILLWVLASASAYKQQSIDVVVNGKSRNMVVFTPNVLPDNSPLMIVTHGMNQNPEYQYDGDKLYEMIDTAKFVVAYLRSDGNTWDTGGTNDQNFVIKTIDEMQARFNIDTNRVYWSGFSMGSMLIFHCIAQMQDRIAAFAPTSGIQFSEQPWNNCKKAVNLIEITSYKDDVFGYEQYGMHAYIENFATHDQHPTYKKTANYRPSPDCYYTGDLEQWSGGPDGGEVWMFSGSEGGHWPSSYNRLLIWNFCKRFSLDPGIPTVTMSSPLTTETYSSFDTISVKVSAKDADGTIRMIRIYIDGALRTAKSSINEPEYEMEYLWVKPKTGTHVVRVVATDNENKNREFSRTITVVDLTPYVNDFNAAMEQALHIMSATEGEQYASAAKLRDQLQQEIDTYTAMPVSPIAAYEQATTSLSNLTAQLQVRKDNLDSYFAAVARVDSVIALYADCPEVTELKAYQRLVMARNYYNLSETQLQQDAKLESAIRQLNSYADMFENATVGIKPVTSHGTIVSEEYYTVDGRRTSTPKGIVIRQIRYADGAVEAFKVLRR